MAATLGAPRAVPVPVDRADAIFEEHLRGMARAAAARRVPLVFATLGANLVDSAPAFEEPPLGDRKYFDAWASFDRRDLAAAEKGFTGFLAGEPRSAFGHYYLALTLDRLGKRSAAAAQYLAAADDDFPGERTSPARNEIIRRVAREEGAAVADLEKVFRALSDRGLPGKAIFKDACHWYAEYYPLVSLTLLRSVYEHDLAAGAAWLARPAEWRWRWADGLERRLRAPAIAAAARKKTYDEAVRSAVAKAIGSQPTRFSEQVVLDLERHLAEDAAEFARLTADDALLSVYDSPWIRELRDRKEEGLAYALLHIGEAYRRRGRLREALARFDESLARRPGYPQGRLRRAVVLAQLGRADQARGELYALAGERPDIPETRQWQRLLDGEGRP
jgi:tetratricopeptide (TPR) repeat protein